MYRFFQFVATFFASAIIGGIGGGFVGAALVGHGKPPYRWDHMAGFESVGAVAGVIVCGACWLISWASRPPSSVEFEDHWHQRNNY